MTTNSGVFQMTQRLGILYGIGDAEDGNWSMWDGPGPDLDAYLSQNGKTATSCILQLDKNGNHTVLFRWIGDKWEPERATGTSNLSAIDFNELLGKQCCLCSGPLDDTGICPSCRIDKGLLEEYQSRMESVRHAGITWEQLVASLVDAERRVKYLENRYEKVQPAPSNHAVTGVVDARKDALASNADRKINQLLDIARNVKCGDCPIGDPKLCVESRIGTCREILARWLDGHGPVRWSK